MELRGSGRVRPSPVGLQYRLQLSRQAGKVAVVHATVVQLLRKLAEEPGPVTTGRFEADADLNAPFDHLDR